MNTFKIGVISDLLQLPFSESMQKCAEIGANGVQLYAVEGEMAPENLSPTQIAEKRNVIKSYGLEVSAICGDLGGHGFTRKEENLEKIERSKRIVNLALELDSKIITTHVGVIPSDTACDKYKIMQQACNELANFALENGAYFAIETGPEPAERLKLFLDSLDCRGVAVNLDPANLVMVTDDDPVQAVYTLKDYIVHTHAKDGVMIKKTDPEIIYNFFADGGIGDLRLDSYFKEMPLGYGKVDFDKYLTALKEIGYSGYLTIEREFGGNPIHDIKMAVEFLKSKM
jgi:L-ribulose-5-phosphate 3-epimerase